MPTRDINGNRKRRARGAAAAAADLDRNYSAAVGEAYARLLHVCIFFFSIAAHLYTHGTLSLADLVGAFVHAIYVGAHAHRAIHPSPTIPILFFCPWTMEACT